MKTMAQLHICSRNGLTDCRLCDTPCGPGRNGAAMVVVKGTRVERHDVDLAVIMAHATWHLCRQVSERGGRLLRAS